MMSDKIILLGGSAGGFSVILELLKTLPKDFKIPIIVIVHRNPRYQSDFEETINNSFQIHIKSALDKELIQRGIVYFAPAGYHLLIDPDYRLALDLSEAIQYSRPSIDVTFESAAEVYKENSIAILFSGANQDGAQGLLAIKNIGGTCIVQDPLCAEVDTMPKAAIALNAQHYIYNIDHIKEYIHQLNH